jgi:PCRF domain
MSESKFFVDIGAVIGGVESQLLVEMLLEMYRSWAANNAIDFERIETTPAYGGGIRYAKFSLVGTDRESFAVLHDGAHTLIRTPANDLNQRRQMSIAGVRSRDDPALPVPQEMGDWGAERRRYICDPMHLIIDSRFGPIEIDPAVIFSGDFSALTAPTQLATQGDA